MDFRRKDKTQETCSEAISILQDTSGGGTEREEDKTKKSLVVRIGGIDRTDGIHTTCEGGRVKDDSLSFPW